MPKPNVFVVEDYKLVILGIPKCAQTSIKRAFLLPETANVHDKSHFQYLNYNEVLDFEKRGYTTATFTRNPYDRLLSFWKQKIKVHSKFVRGASNPFSTGMTFAETVRVVCNILDDHSDIHFKSQVAQIQIDGQFPHFMGSIENIDRDWMDLGHFLEVPLPELPFENRTPDHTDEWTPELRSKVYTRYQQDFRILGYER